MVSIIDTGRRALVTFLKSLAGIYCVAVLLRRQFADAEVSAAFKKVARKAHPDKRGAPGHQKALNAARDAWQDAVRAGKNCGGGEPVHVARQGRPPHCPTPERCQGQVSQLQEGLPGCCLEERSNVQTVK